jgi:hypothetical protein
MPDKFYTKVKASKELWEKVIVKHLEKETPLRFTNLISDELIISSTGKTALDEIKKLSIEYPEEVFKVKIEDNDACNNYVYLYECSKGESKLVKEGYEYYFKLNISDSSKIDPYLLDRFKHEAVCFFKNNRHFLPQEINMDLNDIDYEERNNWSLTFTYETKDVRLTATKKGLTCIKIDVKFLNGYDELPF